MIKQAALFGGSGNNTSSKEYLETVEIGAFLANKGYIIKNGGYGGMMEAVSKGAYENGGKVIGITCKQVGSAVGNQYLSETIITETLYQRLKVLMEGTSLFIVQKGGIGTLSEVFLALDLIRKEPKSQQARIIFIGAFWHDIIAALKQEIIPEYEHYLFQIVKDSEEFMKNF